MRYIVLGLLFFCQLLHAQDYALDKLLETPYISSLTAAKNGATLLFSVVDKGKRNVFMTSPGGGTARQLTNFPEDDGLEITSLQISNNGQWAVFVRGGDHGGNSAVRPTNAASYIVPQKIALYSIALSTGEVKLLGEGDFPVIHPQSKQVAFINKMQAWIAPLDGSSAPKALFQMNGSVRGMQWSPDGGALAFTSRRGDHSYIGVYRENNPRLQWIAPSFYRDDNPIWSPDGKKLTFIRQPASGGALDSLLVRRHIPWSIMVADLADENATELWKAPATLKGSVPAMQGGANLHWPVQEQIVFTSYQDGWPHLYTVNTSGAGVQQLTRGNFAIEDIDLSADGRYIVFSANNGASPQDTDRRHIGIVGVKGGGFQMLTAGEGIETSPCFTNNDKEIALLSNTAQRPLLPAVFSLEKKGEPVLLAKELLGKFDYDRLVTPRQVSFKAPDGLTVHGQLFIPKNLTAKAPAIVYVHGGPRRQMYLGWHNMDYYFYDYQTNQYLASQGFVVLSVNYRMGTGYGYEFQHPAKAGVEGASEYQDILAAGKWLATQKEVNPAAIGIYGGSYGGYLTAMALGKNSDIFKVGVDIHGVHNRKKKLNEEEYAPDFEAAAKAAWNSSPSRWVDSWRSPVLIIHADDDQNVAFSQSIDLVNRLKKKGVKTEYLVIPDDTHHWLLHSNLSKVKLATVSFLKAHLMAK